MALAKDRACSYYGNMFDVLTPIQIPNLSSSSYGFEDQDEYQKQQMFQGGDHEHVFEATSYDQKSHSPPLSSSSSANSSSGFALHPSMYNHHHHHHHHQQQQQPQPQPRQQPQPHEVEAHSLINFKTGAGYGNFMQTSSGSLLSFQQADIDHHHNQRVISPHNYQHTSTNQPNPDHQFPMWEGSGGNSLVTHPFNKLKNTSSNLRMPEDVSHGLQSGNIYQDVGNDWLYDEAIITADSSHHHDTPPPPPPPPPPKACFNKRPPMEDENPEALVKKQCTTNSRKTKPMSTSITKDPQSIAAKNRRERISERLKILQDLVPNGSKVDLVTMLEKAISYVKFLQLQVKVLAADEFWPAAGGKPPDISQVREAIDAILLSQQNDGATPASTSTTSTK